VSSLSGQPRSSRPALRSPLETWFRKSAAPTLPGTAALRFADCSARPRFGCKGPGAPEWLSGAGFRVPRMPNTAGVVAGNLVARLATSEFLVEGLSAAVQLVESAGDQLETTARPAGVYPVARQDLVIEIAGAALNTLLRQVCSVDFLPLFRPSDPNSGPIILTSMVGVGVVAWPRQSDAVPAVTLWIDPSFAHYFWTTLLEVGRDLGEVMVVNNQTVPGSKA